MIDSLKEQVSFYFITLHYNYAAIHHFYDYSYHVERKNWTLLDKRLAATCTNVWSCDFFMIM